jgi:predicted acyltransferase
MLLLLAEGTHLFYFLNAAFPDSLVFGQLLHAKWRGMTFWDLIQPYFTFVIGGAMAFSLNKRWGGGESWPYTFKHMLQRCLILFCLGILLQSFYRERFLWDLYNILTLFSVSILITFLIFRLSYSRQIVISFALLVITELLYRYSSIEGYERPFVIHHNFGTFIDMVLMGRTHQDGWVFFNCIPATAHMIWGVLTGKLMLSESSPNQKIKVLGLACIGFLAAGYGMDWSGISPMIKKTCTSSFMLASGGWCLGTFLLLYWIVDIKGYKKFALFFAIIGMNPIFIYLFSRTIGREVLNKHIPMLLKGSISWTGLTEGMMNLVAYMAILVLEWCLCYLLYKKKIFIKI